MKTNTGRIGAVAGSVAATGLVLGLAFSAGAASATVDSPPTPSAPTMAMNQMMGSGDMTAMHQVMHTVMRGSVPDSVLAACDNAHASMPAGMMVGMMAGTTATGEMDHRAHHTGSGS